MADMLLTFLWGEALGVLVVMTLIILLESEK